MSRLLSPQEYVALQQDTNYLGAGIPVFASRVLFWTQMQKWVLIFNSSTQGYIISDISDLGAARIQALAQQSELHGMWYYLPQSIAEVIEEDVEAVMDAAARAGAGAAAVAQAGAAAIGNTLAGALGPVVGALSIPLVLGVALGVIYLAQKRG